MIFIIPEKLHTGPILGMFSQINCFGLLLFFFCFEKTGLCHFSSWMTTSFHAKIRKFFLGTNPKYC